MPLDERADVAAALLRNLDNAERTLPPAEVAERWAVEITRRAERAVRGESVGREATEVMIAIESKLRR